MFGRERGDTEAGKMDVIRELGIVSGPGPGESMWVEARSQ